MANRRLIGSRDGLDGDGELLVGEDEPAGHGVTEVLGAGAVGADVVVGPQAPEGLALGGELADEVLEPAVMGSWTKATPSVIASGTHRRLNREPALLGVRRQARPEVGPVGPARQVEQMGALGPIEPQGACQ